MIVPVILCGGVGSRLWPISRKTHPKQFLKIHNDHSLFQNTILKFKDHKDFLAPVIVCADDYKFQIAAELEAIAIEPEAIIVEKLQKNTCPAISLAAHYISEKFGMDTQVLVLPSDHIITEESKFIDCVTAAAVNLGDSLLTFGIKPKSAATGYGYIKIGSNLGNGVYSVKEFIEKPDKNSATTYVEAEDYYWNSGMFLFGVKTYLSELEQLKPDIFACTKTSIAASHKVFHFIQIKQDTIAHCENISVDYAIFEKTSKATVMPMDIAWHDLGSWQSIYNYHAKDKDNNVLLGQNIYTNSSTNCLVYSNSDTHVVLHKVDDVFVIVSKDAVLVISSKCSEEVKSVYNSFVLSNNSITERNNVCYRPWGYYEELLVKPDCRVKLIQLNPQSQISLQYHNKRAEHWVITKNSAEVTRGSEVFTITKDESVYIPVGTLHKIKNCSDSVLEFVEVQVGECVGEDDIVRVDDIYQRDKIDSVN